MKAIKITDEFSQLRHKHYLNHGTLDGSYDELFLAISRLGSKGSGTVSSSSEPEDAGKPQMLVSNSITEMVKLPKVRKSADPVDGPGVQLFQTMFYGDPMFSGVGAGGGLGTLLLGLGNILSAKPFDFNVTTLVGRNTNEEHLKVPPQEYAGPKHIIRRLSYEGKRHNNAFFSDEATLKVLLSEAINSERKKSRLPSILHTRYIDGATYAAAVAAINNNCALVSTITPDPHRGICDSNGEIIPRSAEEAAILLYRIKIGDELIRRADALVGIGQNSIEQQLIPYFPQLEKIEGSRLVGIDEGVQFVDNVSPDIDPWEMIDVAVRGLSSSRGEIAKERRHLPVMLNIGRLHPAKAQPALLKAWIESGLYSQYNLVFVGGDLKTPNPTESGILQELDVIISRAPAEARAGYLHVGALSNNDVRLLEVAFAQKPANVQTLENPHIYVCSSPKEEFGISILEAMAAGLPVFAPIKGGAPSYIEHGTNGLLIDTSSSKTLTADLARLLHPDSPILKKLNQIALAGRETVRKRYSLDGPAAKFAEVYQAAIKHKQGGR